MNIQWPTGSHTMAHVVRAFRAHRSLQGAKDKTHNLARPAQLAGSPEKIDSPQPETKCQSATIPSPLRENNEGSEVGS